MQSSAKTVAEYLASLPDDRRESLQAILEVMRKNVPQGIEEGMQYGMIGFFLPHSLYPAGYHCDPKQPLNFAALASQKNYISIYMMCAYMNPADADWLRDAFAKAGKKLDMGKSCLRFKKFEDIPLDVIGQALRRVKLKSFIAQYEAALGDRKPAKSSKPAATKSAPKVTKKAPPKKSAPKKSAKKAASK